MAVERHGQRWRVRIGAGANRVFVGSYPTKGEAEQAQTDYYEQQRPAAATPSQPIAAAMVQGVTNEEDSDEFDAQLLWQTAFAVQDKFRKRAMQRLNQTVRIPEHDAQQPIAIAFLSDTHFGNAGTDYRAAERDARVIQSTPGLYAGWHGDGTDNWIIGKLQSLQRYQPIPYDAEVALFADFVRMLKAKWLWFLPGNHDNWTTKLAHIEPIKQTLVGVRVLYDPQEIVFNLEHGQNSVRVKVRHKWRGGSIFNPTHAIETGWERGGNEFDWGIGGHTHVGTYCRPFTRHGKRRYAILTGTYKVEDSFGREIGFAPPDGLGCGAMVLHPDGRQWWMESLPEAADFLGWLREKARAA
jgi:hypothetical protein